MNVNLLNEDGSQGASVELLDEIFAAKVNVPLMHQVVTAQLAAARAGTHATKTRAEVRGGGRKPWRQKGTGRARHGSTREPQWVGGGTAHGPQPRSYRQSIPKKMKALALRSALSVRAGDGKVVVVEDMSFDQPKTSRAAKALKTWNLPGRPLVVLAGDETALAYSFRNIDGVHVIAEGQLNVYDILRADTVVFARRALDAFQSRAAVLPGRRGGGSAASDEEPGIETPADVAQYTAPQPIDDEGVTS
ncbi:MAG TPA: 50S ribosomal protein L4 [Actinomycetota bacterium]|nr:50S ribosomal protein L4 [Actinomycetota bacterium]